MNEVLEQSERLIASTKLDFRRYLAEYINWDNQLIGIKGARGAGKTTMLLQWLKSLKLPSDRAAYFSLDDLYFSENSLKSTVTQFYKNGGKILLLDEVHKYENWSKEIKNIYDFFPDIKVIYTGSSILELTLQSGDLSRRAVIYDLPGLSFREYLQMKGIIKLNKINLEDLLFKTEEVKESLPRDFRPLEHFKNYLAMGYYPFGLTDPSTLHQRINQMLRTIVEIDMAEIKDFDIRNAKKMLQLIYLISQKVPFKPNLTELASKTGIHRNTLNHYLDYLEKAEIITLLYPDGTGLSNLQKPEKIYLNNTTKLNAMSKDRVEVGTIRETFFLSQMKPFHKIQMPKQGDFIVDEQYTFEVGGRNKTKKQIEQVENSWVVSDDLEYPIMRSLPLWMFGMLY